MPTPQEARRLFSQLLRLPDQEIDLVEAALLIAARQGSDGHTDLCLAQLATLAHRVPDHPVDRVYGGCPPGGTALARDRYAGALSDWVLDPALGQGSAFDR